MALTCASAAVALCQRAPAPSNSSKQAGALPAAGLAVVHEARQLSHCFLPARAAVAGVPELWHACCLLVHVQGSLPQLVACRQSAASQLAAALCSAVWKGLWAAEVAESRPMAAYMRHTAARCSAAIVLNRRQQRPLREAKRRRCEMSNTASNTQHRTFGHFEDLQLAGVALEQLLQGHAHLALQLLQASRLLKQAQATPS